MIRVIEIFTNSLLAHAENRAGDVLKALGNPFDDVADDAQYGITSMAVPISPASSAAFASERLAFAGRS